MRGLQAQDYSAEQIEGALDSVFGVDSQLVADGTYLVAVDSDGLIGGCGGWSMRRTLYGGDRARGREDLLLDPAQESAKIRAFFVHPSWARRGVASVLLDACERAAAQAGFRSFELGATLTGVRFFGARGYAAVERIEVPLSNGATLPVIRMSKVQQ